MALGLPKLIYLLNKLCQLDFNHLTIGDHGIKLGIALFDGLIKTSILLSLKLSKILHELSKFNFYMDER